MSSIKFGFNPKNNNQQKINEYNKKTLLQVQNMVANQKRMIENQKRMIENQKIAALNQQPLKPNVVVNHQQPKPDIIRLNVKVNSLKIV